MKHDKDKAFDEMLRQKMTGHQPEVSASLWSRIQEELDQQTQPEKPTTSMRERTSSRKPWYRIGAAAAIILLAGAWLWQKQAGSEVIYLKSDTPARPSTESRLSKIDPFPAYSVDTGQSDSIQQAPDKPNDKLADDLQTISQVLAAVLERTERKTQQAEVKPETTNHQIKTPDETQSHVETAFHTEPRTTIDTRVGSPGSPGNLSPGSTSLSAGLSEPQLAYTDTHPIVIVEELNTSLPGAEEATIEADRKMQPESGVSRLLNLMIAQIDRRSEKLISFSSDDEGSIKIDLNLAHNRR